MNGLLEVDIKLCLHTHKWSYIMEKLQAKNHYMYAEFTSCYESLG
jgi:hypothetical protein